MPSNSVIIVGGGLAGLAAASALGRRGCSVTLLESRPRLGGRASSFVDKTTGAKIDNCQHVSMGCCTNFDHFCREVGIDHLLQPQPELWFIGPGGERSRFAASASPAPLHLLPALWRLAFLSTGEKRRLLSGLSALLKTKRSGETIAEWLAAHGQSPTVIERFWRVVLVSALSESLDRIDVSAARKVFADGFAAHRDGWRVTIPAVPLETLYGRELTDWLTRHGVEVRLQCGVKSVLVSDGTAVGVELRDGSQLDADHIILAVPQDRVSSLLPEEERQRGDLPDFDSLETAPISSVHLWFDRPVIDLPHAVLVERLSQWVFSRGSTPASDGGEPWHYYQVVISASHDLQGRLQSDVISQVVGELAEIWPDVSQSGLKHSRLVTEHKAVLSMVPGVDSLRPPQQSPVTGLQFAGDWTATGWPSTMEGAVRSGYLAAENILAAAGTSERLIRPDLRTGLLSKILFGL